VQILEIQGVGELRVIRYEGHESMSRLFEFEVYVSSKEGDVALADAVGQKAHLRFGADEERQRHVHGIVRRFEHTSETLHGASFKVTVVPDAFRLTLRRDCRIFQEMSVIDIVKKVFASAGFSDQEFAITGSYPTREYCVQYRETDWDFVNRLLEHEGVFYFFEHTDGGCKLVVADDNTAHDPISGEATLHLRAGTGALDAQTEHVTGLHFGEELQSGKITMRDYNFKTPGLSLEVTGSGAGPADLEVYDYPGGYIDGGAGSGLVGSYLDAIQARRVTGDGRSNCARMAPGHKFSLEDSPRADFNIEYLVTRVEHRGADPTIDQASGVEPYANRFTVMPAKDTFRPDRVTPRPTINGVQTAVVTGPGGEEIHTDEHGRIKVQFHWDRQGKKDDKSSCWVRVKQPWAGAGWGSVWIPRIGQEVVIDFIEGDPDRPLCSGAVYHAKNVPPYSLPGEKTKSTIKSNSTIGGGGFNEMRFEDKKGSEEIYVHGQKDWTIKIEHDKNQEVVHDENHHIGHDHSHDVGHDQTIKIHHDRNKTVDNDQNESVGGNKGIRVGKDHTESIGGNETITVKGNEAIAVGMTREVMVGVANAVTVGAAHMLTVGLDLSEKSGANFTQSAGRNMSVSVGKDHDTTVKQNQTLKVNKNQEVEITENQTVKVMKVRKDDTGEDHTVIVGKKWALQCGEATITVEKNGNISIAGKDLTVKGTGPIKVEGKKLDVKSDGAVTVKASGKVTVKGSNVDLN
jgi:type VI secretion system secreted protein VgrG